MRFVVLFFVLTMALSGVAIAAARSTTPALEAPSAAPGLAVQSARLAPAAPSTTPAPEAPSKRDAPKPEDSWTSFAFLLGNWDASGGGAPGESKGKFSFRTDLDGRVLVRRNESSSPSGHHEDLMVIYRAAPSAVRAIYFDNEGHVINYSVTAGEAPPEATFLSDETAGAPRFRLTYRVNQDGTMKVAFEIAPPGAAQFKRYLEGTARRE